MGWVKQTQGKGMQPREIQSLQQSSFCSYMFLVGSCYDELPFLYELGRQDAQIRHTFMMSLSKISFHLRL